MRARDASGGVQDAGAARLHQHDAGSQSAIRGDLLRQTPPPGVLELPRPRSCSNSGPPAESWLYGLRRLYSLRRPEGHRRGVVQLQPRATFCTLHTPHPTDSRRLALLEVAFSVAERRSTDGAPRRRPRGRRVGAGGVAASDGSGGRRSEGGSTAEWRRRQHLEPRTFPVNPL